MSDLLSLKRDFCEIVKRTQPWILSHFVMWLDLKVSEYKVYGYMLLEQGIEKDLAGKAVAECTTRTGLRPEPASTDSTNDSIDQCHQKACVLPKSCLSLTPCTRASQCSEIYVSATPIFKRSASGNRANRRKQQHVYRRGPGSLLSALSGDIQNTVCSLDDRTGFWGVDHTQGFDDVSLSEHESTVGNESSRLEIEIQSVESACDKEDGRTNYRLRDWKDAEIESDCSVNIKSMIDGMDLDDDVKVLSSQYEHTHVDVQRGDDENTSKHRRKSHMSKSETSGVDNVDEECIPKSLLPTKHDNTSPVKCPNFVFNYSATRTMPSKQRSQDAGKRTNCSKSQVKQEVVMDGLEIKVEPVDALFSDSSTESPCIVNQPPDSRHLFQEHQFACETGTRTGWNVNAGSISQCVDSKRQRPYAETDKNQHSGLGSEHLRHMSTSTPTGIDPSLTCNLCGAAFKFKSSLSRHKALHGEKRYHCFVCPKAFHRREHLLLHLQRHANSAMIACPACSMRTSSVKHLEEHYRLNHGAFIQIGVPPYIAGSQSG